MIERHRNQPEQYARTNRLFDEPHGSSLHGLNRQCNIAMSSDDDGRQRVPTGLEPRDHIDAGHAGHL